MQIDMILSLPLAYRQDPWIQAIMQAIDLSDRAQRAEIENISMQIFPFLMTWQIAKEEAIAWVTSAADADMDDRRSAVIAKWRSGAGRVGIEMIQTVCGSWPGVRADVSYDGVGTVAIVYHVQGEHRPDIAAIQSAIREILPAHLGFGVIEILYRNTSATVWTASGGSVLRSYQGSAEVTRGARSATYTSGNGSIWKLYQGEECNVEACNGN